MGLTSDLATNWDLAGATKQTVMSDERDFTRPREDFNMSNVPKTLLQGAEADDIFNANDDLVKYLQKMDKPVDKPVIQPAVKPDEKTPSEATGATSDQIKQFQAFFGLPQTGNADEKLAAAAKAIEDKISKSVNNHGAHGLLWDDSSKTFKTNLSDLQEALKKIEQYESNKKVSTNTKTPRIQAFLDLFHNNANSVKKI